MNRNEAIKKAKKCEDINDWEEAAVAWRKAGMIDDAESCEFIAASVKRGDTIRANSNNN